MSTVPVNRDGEVLCLVKVIKYGISSIAPPIKPCILLYRGTFYTYARYGVGRVGRVGGRDKGGPVVRESLIVRTGLPSGPSTSTKPTSR
jgi:hypothetical protein